MSVTVLIKYDTTLTKPEYATEFSSGMDIRAKFVDKTTPQLNAILGKDFFVAKEGASIILDPGGRFLCPTGLFVAIPVGYEIQVRPRSGLAIKHGITVLNSPGTVDCDFRGEIGIILINQSNDPFIINDGDRIAQMILTKVEKIEWLDRIELPTTVRGEAGFNSTGIQ